MMVGGCPAEVRGSRLKPSPTPSRGRCANYVKVSIRQKAIQTLVQRRNRLTDFPSRCPHSSEPIQMPNVSPSYMGLKDFGTTSPTIFV